MKPTKLFPSEHSVVVYHHAPEFGVTIEDLQKPDYWTHVAPQLRQGHRIEVMAGDGSFWAMLLVRAAGRRDAVVGLLQHVKFGGEVEATVDDSPFEVVWRGPARKFSVVRKDDKEVIRDEFAVKEHAVKWMQNHLKSLAA